MSGNRKAIFVVMGYFGLLAWISFMHSMGWNLDPFGLDFAAATVVYWFAVLLYTA